MTYLLESFFDASTSPLLLQLFFACGALLAVRCGCGHCHNHDEGEEENNDAQDEEADMTFNFSKQQLEEFNEMLAETNARIEELASDLASGQASDAREAQEELIQLYLSRAARKQVEEEYESAAQDYDLAFESLAAFMEVYGESLDALKQAAAARLNYGILLNDSGELEDADEQYALAIEANKKLAAFGDKEARLDLIGLQLNRASIAFDQGDEEGAVATIDRTIEDFQRLADENPDGNAEALYYLAKAHSTKADFLTAMQDEEEDFDSHYAVSAREALSESTKTYRSLVNAGYSNYKRDLSESLVKLVSCLPKRSSDEIQATLEPLAEACETFKDVYQQQEILTESNKNPDTLLELLNLGVDYFDVLMMYADMLTQLKRNADAASLYDAIVQKFDQFSESNELPLIEGMAIAYQRRSLLRKGKIANKQLIADLTKAIDLHSKIADSLMGTLDESHHDDKCGCGRHHDDKCDCGCGKDGCKCGSGKDGCQCNCGEDGCKCGCGKDGCQCNCGEDGCQCGCGEDGCKCGSGKDGCQCNSDKDDRQCGCGDCTDGDCSCCSGTPDRKYLIDRWVNDNFRAMTECLYELLYAHLEDKNKEKAYTTCAYAEKLEKMYRSVLHDDEQLDMEFMKTIREIGATL